MLVAGLGLELGGGAAVGGEVLGEKVAQLVQCPALLGVPAAVKKFGARWPLSEKMFSGEQRVAGVAPRFRALTLEIDDTSSPVRQFLGERFTCGLKDLQRMFRQAAPPLAVPPVPQAEANPGTVGTAADWMLRFLLHPRPSLAVPRVGAVLCRVEDPQPDMETLGMLGRDGGMLPLCAGLPCHSAWHLARSPARSAWPPNP